MFAAQGISSVLISMSKVFVGDVTSEVVDKCLQFHGGAGYMDEFMVSRAWRDKI